MSANVLPLFAQPLCPNTWRKGQKIGDEPGPLVWRPVLQIGLAVLSLHLFRQPL